MTQGTIEGGWGYVIAAYTLTATALSAYAWSLVSRYRRAKNSEDA